MGSPGSYCCFGVESSSRTPTAGSFAAAGSVRTTAAGTPARAIPTPHIASLECMLSLTFLQDLDLGGGDTGDDVATDEPVVQLPLPGLPARDALYPLRHQLIHRRVRLAPQALSLERRLRPRRGRHDVGRRIHPGFTSCFVVRQRLVPAL